MRAARVLFLTSLFFFYGFGLNNIFDALGATLSVTYNLTPDALGWISSLYFWANVISLIPMGLLCDRISPKQVILGALFISVLTVLSINFSNQIWVLILSRIFMGVAGGCIFVGCIRIAVNWFKLHQMARVTGFIVTMGMLGGFMVQSPLIILIHHTNWHVALEVAAGIGGLIFVLIFLGVADHPERESDLNNLNKNSQESIWENLKLVFKNKQNWIAGLAGSLNNLPIFMLGALWGVPYLIHVAHLSETSAGWICGMLYFGTMLGSPMIGFISDSLGLRKWPMLFSILLSIFIILLCIGLSISSVFIWGFLFFLLGMTASAQVLAYPIVAESNPHRLISTATSIISIQMLLGGAISEPLFGAIVQHFGGEHSMGAYQMAMNILPIAFCLAFVMGLFLKEKKINK